MSRARRNEMSRNDKDKEKDRKKPGWNDNNNAHRSMLEREQEEKLDQLASITGMIKEVYVKQHLT